MQALSIGIIETICPYMTSNSFQVSLTIDTIQPNNKMHVISNLSSPEMRKTHGWWVQPPHTATTQVFACNQTQTNQNDIHTQAQSPITLRDILGIKSYDHLNRLIFGHPKSILWPSHLSLVGWRWPSLPPMVCVLACTNKHAHHVHTCFFMHQHNIVLVYKHMQEHGHPTIFGTTFP